MNKRTFLTHTIIYIGCFLIMIGMSTDVTLAQDYTPLATLPGMPNNASSLDTSDYISALYTLSITAAALLVVVRIILAGVKYMFSEVVNKKEEAKKDIRNALLGLLIILSAVLILNTINPSLTDISFLNGTQSINTTYRENPSPSPDVCDVGGCSVSSCEYFDTLSGLGYWKYLATGIQYSEAVANRAVCSAYCSYLGGTIENRSATNSGQCRYPEDLEAAEQALAKLQSEELAAELPAEDIPGGSLVVRCGSELGDTNCGESILACANGDVLPDGVRGDPVDTVTESGVNVVICRNPSVVSGGGGF